jgi:hypothetical protein
MNGFVALHRSETALVLLENYPSAFLLLTQIAVRARWKDEPCLITGLNKREAFIGDFKTAGLKSEKAYRNAKERLKQVGLCDFRRATQGAKRGTIATLLNEEVFSVSNGGGAEPRTAQGQREDEARATKNKETRKQGNKERAQASPFPSYSSPPSSRVFSSIRDELGQVFPNALGLSDGEEELIKKEHSNLSALTKEDWTALRVWFVEATEPARGKKLWPTSREHFLELIGETVEKVRRWWNESGKTWWTSEKERRRRREVRTTAETNAKLSEETTKEESLAWFREMEMNNLTNLKRKEVAS